ncbi:MAG: DsrE/DsrF/DrsH-like family protein [Promethearchaeota archaeon]
MTKKILYVLTSGLDTPERLYAPFVLASTAKAMGIDATIYFVVKGVEVVKKGEAEKIKMGNFPTLKEVIDQAIEAGVELMACDQSTQVLGIERGGYIDTCGVVGAATLNDIALEADAILTF